MAESLKLFREWLDRNVSPSDSIAINDDGLCVVILDADGQPTGASYEVGGIPECTDCEGTGYQYIPPNAEIMRPCPVCSPFDAYRLAHKPEED
jgi:hypothetical protein